MYQHLLLLKYADAQKLTIDHWIEETVSGTTKISERKLGQLLATMQLHDVLLVTELSRLGRSLMEVMSVLHGLMEHEVTVYAIVELAQKLGGITQWHVSHLETGSKQPSLDLIITVAEFFDVSIDQLLRTTSADDLR